MSLAAGRQIPGPGAAWETRGSMGSTMMMHDYTSSRRRVSCAPLLLGSLLLASLAACGGGDSAPPAQTKDPYLLTVTGAQVRSLSLSTDKMQVTCKPKPGLGEFTFEAAPTSGATTGDYFKFTIEDYTEAKTYDMEYGTSNTQHTIELGLENKHKESSSDKDYKYKFFQSIRTDLNTTMNSLCSITLEENNEDISQTVFSGYFSCILLFADFDSPDYDSGVLDKYVDIDGHFECVYAL
jgi:hypothetical protein